MCPFNGKSRARIKGIKIIKTEESKGLRYEGHYYTSNCTGSLT
jgi:hypothetical protein